MPELGDVTAPPRAKQAESKREEAKSSLERTAMDSADRFLLKHQELEQIALERDEACLNRFGIPESAWV